ncbi:MAG TPA: hypothetical protein VFS20_15750 [Longimicrobium sp.]|nr:hypothetical protein [Longimicrobium sp.]
MGTILNVTLWGPSSPTVAFLCGYAGLAVGFPFGGLRRAAIKVERDEAVLDRVLARGMAVVSGILATAGVVGYMLTLVVDLSAKSIMLSEVFVQSLPYGILGAMVGVILYGGLDLCRHLVLRILLIGSRVLPPRTSRWLEHCARLGLLQRIGSGYTFVHRLLLEYFEQARPERSPGTPVQSR